MVSRAREEEDSRILDSWTMSSPSSTQCWKQGLDVAAGAAPHPFALLLIPLHCYVIPHAAPGLVPPPFREEKQLPWAAHLHSQALRRL